MGKNGKDVGGKILVNAIIKYLLSYLVTKVS
jgi:hypothetical protein